MQASTTVSVRAPAALDEARRDLGGDRRVVDRLAAQRRLGESRRAAREPTSVTSQPWAKSRIRARVYSRCTVASVPSTDTSLLCEAAQAGLIAGTVPTNGTAKRARRCGSTSVEAVLQAITTRSGRWAAISSPISGDDAGDQRRFVVTAVGKERVVGDVDEARVRPRLRDLAEHGEAAEAGIEDQNGRGGRRLAHPVRLILEGRFNARPSIQDLQDDHVRIPGRECNRDAPLTKSRWPGLGGAAASVDRPRRHQRE